MKYTLWTLFVVYILLNGCRMEGMAIGCLFLMTILLTYCTFKSLKQPIPIFIKNAMGLLFILGTLFSHFDMMEGVVYCVLFTGLIIAYVIFKAVFGSAYVHKAPSNTSQQNSDQPATFTYVATKNQSTSF